MKGHENNERRVGQLTNETRQLSLGRPETSRLTLQLDHAYTNTVAPFSFFNNDFTYYINTSARTLHIQEDAVMRPSFLLGLGISHVLTAACLTGWL